MEVSPYIAFSGNRKRNSSYCVCAVTRFPELKTAVEKFVNSRDFLFVPDYKDILKIVTQVNENSRPPLLAKEDVEETGLLCSTYLHAFVCC